MKKLLLILLAGLFLFSACELEEEQDTSFVGTWSGIMAMDVTGDDVADNVTMEIILTESTFEMTMTYMDSLIGAQKGSLEADGAQVTLTPTHASEDGTTWTLITDLIVAYPDDFDSSDLEPMVSSWSVSGDILTIDEGGDEEMAFTKQ